MELKNDHNVYILGAGFSREARLPLISDFLIRMRDSHPWLISNNRTREAEAVQRVLEFRLQAASAAYWVNLDLENIEELFSLASASPNQISYDIQLAIAATIQFCFETGQTDKKRLFVSQNNAPTFPEWINSAPWLAGDGYTYGTGGFGYNVNAYTYYVAKLLGMLDNGHPKGENTFITFNYDTILEDALADLKVPFSYGFNGDDNITDPSAKVSTSKGSIPVLKLHGSLNWAQRNKGENGKFNVFGSYAEVLAANLSPELIPPTWKKTFQGQLGEVWGTAVNSLRTATRVVIIGFSMPPTDTHFKYLIAAGLQQNISLRQIIFYNPAADEIMERSKTVFRGSYIESQKILFEKHPLQTLGSQQELLADIGRPSNNLLSFQF